MIADLASFLPLMAGVLTGVVAGARKLNGRDRWHRLLHDCEYQHAALIEGHESVGVYGHYPPARV